MQTLTRPTPSSIRPSRRRPRFSPLMFIGAAVTLIIALGAGTYFILRPHFGSHAAGVNGDCTLILPSQPLTAQGLATPYQLTATDPANGPCNEANAGQSAFVQGAIIDPATGQIAIYNPLVIDQGTQAAIAPKAPMLPANAVVALWFGSNGTTLSLLGTDSNLSEAHCVNGLNGSIFGQFSACNAPAFFAAANAAIKAGKLVVPPLGKGKDGLSCPSTRDFSVIDQDQSDNVTTTYLITGNGQTAQMTAANSAQLQNANIQANGSDERLLAVALDGALGCTPWTAPDLADPGHNVPALPLNELQAAALQANPVALVPAGDPMVQVNGKPNLQKVNDYRRSVDQPAARNMADASTKTYCTNLMNIAPERMMFDAPLTKAAASPDPNAANSLFTFLAQRFNTSWGATGGLNCQGILNANSPIVVTTDANGVAIDATIQGASIGGGPAITACAVNGTAIPNCAGTATINGQACSFAVDAATQQLNITCPAAQPGPQQKPPTGP